DTTGGALPGVTVRAVHEASGNSFEAVTDERGDYRIPARVGAYRLTAELAGFAPATRTVTLLVGQAAVINLQMSLSGVQESVTVTGEAPLLDVTQSSLGGNVDSRQLQELPVNGRNWLDLVMLAPGAQVNSITNTPSQVGGGDSRVGGDFEINVDGQQITNVLAAADKAMPRFSRDAVAEFELLSGRFDATQGRSTGLQVNMVTKSGANTPAGSFSGYFRNNRFNAADHVAKRVLPYEDQQLSSTFGGPIRRDRVHFFGHYEYESEPVTRVWTTRYPSFNADLSSTHSEKKGGLRLDGQFTPRTRLSFRGGAWTSVQPGSGSADSTPSNAGGVRQVSNQLFLTLTQVLSNQVVNEVKLGQASTYYQNYFDFKNPRAEFGYNSPWIRLSGLDLGGGQYYPNHQGQEVYSVRDDFTYSFSKGGRHTMKLGGEYLHQIMWDKTVGFGEGQLIATGGPIPANIEALFPDLFDPSTWNLAGLSSISRTWTQGFGAAGSAIPRYSSAVWVQDDWSVTPRLTLNLGLRYDLEANAFANDIVMLPFLTGHQQDDTNNVGPRTGFTFSLNDRTVIRGGYGLYFGTVANAHFAKQYSQRILYSVTNDGRPDFASNPFNGPTPTFESLSARVCTPALLPGCIRRDVLTGGPVYAANIVMPYSHQASIGLQRQIGPLMSVDADYAYTGTRNFLRDMPVNITYDPATGVNYPFRDISRRAFPEWGYVSLTVPGARANRHALQTALTKRMSSGWQASATYTLAAARDAKPFPVQWDGSTFATVPFPTAPDLGGEYSLAIGDQRHRAVLNGVWQLPYGVQLSGLYFFGSGERHWTQWGPELRGIGQIRPNEHRLRPDGTIVKRNDFVGRPIHRVDLRLQYRIPLVGRLAADGLLEIFNVFNHANYGSYAGTSSSSAAGEVSANYLQPQQNRNLAYAPRMLQLGFRLAF
ncbi:MAG: TonB-dependent receptor, partial [Acidobacteria bacterium]|nr:TonB-dependent receptor [Acidobacteriota bacterium]